MFKRFLQYLIRALNVYPTHWTETRLNGSWFSSWFSSSSSAVTLKNTPESSYTFWHYRGFLPEFWRWMLVITFRLFLNHVELDIFLGLVQPNSGSLSCWISVRTHIYHLLVSSGHVLILLSQCPKMTILYIHTY